jgi:hypothetical protein
MKPERLRPPPKKAGDIEQALGAASDPDRFVL